LAKKKIYYKYQGRYWMTKDGIVVYALNNGKKCRLSGGCKSCIGKCVKGIIVGSGSSDYIILESRDDFCIPDTSAFKEVKFDGRIEKWITKKN